MMPGRMGLFMTARVTASERLASAGEWIIVYDLDDVAFPFLFFSFFKFVFVLIF